MAKAGKICIGQFAGAHGVRGLLKLRSFTGEPEALFGYGDLTNEEGETIKVNLKSSGGDHFIVEVEGCRSREEAEELRGVRLYVLRKALPKPAKGEYFEADLIGLEAFDGDGKAYGKIMGVHDHGAGVFLEIGKSKKESFMLPFTDVFVPDVDINEGRINIVWPKWV